MKDTIAVVIVTYNRLECLKKSLELYDGQSVSADKVYVINNASTDGTDSYLKTWEAQKSRYKKQVLNLTENSGGSGGFYQGIKSAYDDGYDWILVADDDAYPEQDVIEKLQEKIEYCKTNIDAKIAAICTAVINNGEFDLRHRKRIDFSKFSSFEKCVPVEEYNKEYFKIDFFSYVGTAINRKAIEKMGFTQKDYFIYYDDSEHSVRLRKYGEILCFPDMKMIHDTIQSKVMSPWRSYYYVRNQLNLAYNNFPKKCYYKYKIYYILALIKRCMWLEFDFAKAYMDGMKDFPNDRLGKNKKYHP